MRIKNISKKPVRGWLGLRRIILAPGGIRDVDEINAKALIGMGLALETKADVPELKRPGTPLPKKKVAKKKVAKKKVTRRYAPSLEDALR